ncbi:hypothetical protein WNB94_17005 [Aquabacterium sp. A3]|uniref:hypothetical protein n=1 Tax=Aquabacterium sp. A3 TaxID=3132829 RepID=UPI0031191EB5
MNNEPTKSGFPAGYDPLQESGQLSPPKPASVKIFSLSINKTTQIRAAAVILLIVSIEIFISLAKTKIPLLLLAPLFLTATALVMWIKAPDAPPAKRNHTHLELAFYIALSFAAIAAAGYTLSVSEITLYSKRGNLYVLTSVTLWMTTIALACAAINMLAKVYDNLTQHRLASVCIYISAIAQWVGWAAMSAVFASLWAPIRS